MTDSQQYGFAKLVPGFDFLQNLAKGTTESLPQMPNLSSWVAPTLDVEELEKRIQELRAVHFWLEQNSKALGATIQALEVQKMTLATLQGMNCSMADLAQAMSLTPKPAAAEPSASPKATGTSSSAKTSKAAKTAQSEAGGGGLVDPLQWWGSLTQQFQHIASTVMQDAAQAAQAAQDASAKPAAKPAPKPTAKTTKKTVRTPAKPGATSAGRAAPTSATKASRKSR